MHLSPLPERSNLSSADVNWLNDLRDTVNVLVSNAGLDETDYANKRDDVIAEREKVAEQLSVSPNALPVTDSSQLDIDARVESALTRLLRRAGIDVPARDVRDSLRDDDVNAPRLTEPKRDTDVEFFETIDGSHLPDDVVPTGPTLAPVPVGGDKPGAPFAVTDNPANVPTNDPFNAQGNPGDVHPNPAETQTERRRR